MSEISTPKAFIDMSIAELIDVLENRQADITYHLQISADPDNADQICVWLTQGSQTAVSISGVGCHKNYPLNGWFSLLFPGGLADPIIISTLDYNRIVDKVLEHVHQDEMNGNSVKVINFRVLRAENCKVRRGIREDIEEKDMPGETNYHTHADAFDKMWQLFLWGKMTRSFCASH